MRNRIGTWPRILVMTALIGIGGVSAARADEQIVANVPFPFIVHGVLMPAGSYTVTEEAAAGGVCLIASADRAHAIYVITTPSSSNRPADKPELLFEKFGNQYFLSRVVPLDGNEREIVLTPAKMEHQLTEVAASQGPPAPPSGSNPR